MHFILVLLLFSHFLFYSNAQSAATADNWKLDDVFTFLMNGSSNGHSLSSALGDLTRRATGEVDRLYHQLEGVLRQQSSVTTRLNPSELNENCTCYCRCPHGHVSSRVIDDIKGKVMDLRKTFEHVGQSIKHKLHEITAH